MMVRHGWKILRSLSKICQSRLKWIGLACWKSTEKCCSSTSSRLKYGRWVSNLPLHIKVLIAARLVILLTAIAGGIYFFCHYQLGQDNKLDGQNQPESLGESAELSHSEPSHHFANDRSTGFLVLNYEKPDCLSVFSTILKLGGRQMKNPYL